MDISETIDCIDRLSDRSRGVLAGIAEGKSIEEIARALGMRKVSVEARAAHIYRSLGFARDQVVSRMLRRSAATRAYQLWKAAKEAKGNLQPTLERLQQGGFEIDQIDAVRSDKGKQIGSIVVMNLRKSL